MGESFEGLSSEDFLSFFFYRGEDVECVLVGLKMNPMTFGHRERKMHFFVLWSLKRGNNLVQT